MSLLKRRPGVGSSLLQPLPPPTSSSISVPAPLPSLFGGRPTPYHPAPRKLFRRFCVPLRRYQLQVYPHQLLRCSLQVCWVSWGLCWVQPLSGIFLLPGRSLSSQVPWRALRCAGDQVLGSLGTPLAVSILASLFRRGPPLPGFLDFTWNCALLSPSPKPPPPHQKESQSWGGGGGQS